MKDVCYDLTELFFASGRNFKCYGISRTVMEVAYEMAKSNRSVRFVIYSPLHQRFFEVQPRFDDPEDQELLQLALPYSAKPRRLRQNLGNKGPLSRIIYRFASIYVNFCNRLRWSAVPAGVVRDIDLNGKVLISLGSPKIQSDYILALHRSGVNVDFVPLLHDLIPLHDFSGRAGFSYPDNFLYDNQVIISAAKLVLANSAFTKAELVSFANRGVLPSMPLVCVTPLCHEFRAKLEAPLHDAISEKYLLCVGIQTGRKNLECLLDAMLLLIQMRKEVPDLVLAGARRKKVERLCADVRYAALTGKIKFVYDPTQAELKAIYERAYALVLPSRMEGWGLPVGEALWLGTPVLAADVPALREVGGGDALYFSPDRPDALAGLVSHLLESPSAYSSIKDAIRQRKKYFRTWKDVADEIYRAVGGIRLNI